MVSQTRIANAMLQGTQLFKLFRLLQTPCGQGCEFKQRVTLVHVETQVNIVQPSDHLRLPRSSRTNGIGAREK